MPMTDDKLPPLAEAGPCRKGCGKALGAMPAPRARHENRCTGVAKGKPNPPPVTRKAPARRAPAAPAAKQAPKGGGRFADAIHELRMNRLDKELEIAQIDKAIEALENLG